jgi:hypothetical protein
MIKSLDYYIGRLPQYIGKEIFKFVMPDAKTITFLEHYNPSGADNYSNKYKVAFVEDRQLKSESGKYLSRIEKKNGKHRYYITEEYEIEHCDGCGSSKCRSEYCGRIYTDNYVRSKYVSKDIDISLLTLLFNKQ